jgi:hypothetical protein
MGERRPECLDSNFDGGPLCICKRIDRCQEPYQRFCVAGKSTGRPAMLAEYFRRQADICLRLSLVASSEEGTYQMIAKAREYTAKADAIEALSKPNQNHR